MSHKFQFLIILALLALLLNSCKNIDDIELKGVSKVEFRGIQDNAVYFVAGLNVHNPSGMRITLKEVNLKTVADGNFIGTLRCSEKITITSRCDSVYMVPLNLELSNIISGASVLYRLSRKSKVKLEVQGYVKVRSLFINKKIDVSESQVLDIPKFIR